LPRKANPLPGEHEILKTWKGPDVMTMVRRGARKQGKSVSKMEIGGLWLTASSKRLAGAKFEGRGIDGYDRRRKSTPRCGSIR
jgi:hypothetical protein